MKYSVGDKITLRLKADHSVVLPEATVYSSAEGGFYYYVRFGNISDNAFYKSDWEPVPPPFVLPTLTGAVVAFAGGVAILADPLSNDEEWFVNSQEGRGKVNEWISELELLEKDCLVILSEGVVV